MLAAASHVVAADRVDHSPAVQAKRLALIQQVMATGIFTKVDASKYAAHAWVGPAFYAIDFDTKRTFVALVYAYYFDGSHAGDLVILKDSMTGKKVGTFTAISGLELE